MALTLKACHSRHYWSTVGPRSININNKYLGYNNKERQVFLSCGNNLTLEYQKNKSSYFCLSLLFSNFSFLSLTRLVRHRQL